MWRPKTGQEETNIYLMLNHRNGFIKIGRSKNPTFREKQLQSEEPEIELLDSVQAHYIWEQELHFQFRKKKIRGEWFSLTNEDLLSIRNLFQTKRDRDKRLKGVQASVP